MICRLGLLMVSQRSCMFHLCLLSILSFVFDCSNSSTLSSILIFCFQLVPLH
jgi:hypothetical protein